MGSVCVNTPYAGGFVDNVYTASGGRNGESFYKFNTAYQFNDELLAYFTFSQGFRRGGTNGFKDLGPNNVVAADAREYRPDSTNNFEFGLKGYAFDRALYLELALYRIDWKKTQTYRAQDVGGFPVNGTANGPSSRSQGAEISARYKISPAWQLTYTGATTDAQWTETLTQCLYVSGTECRTWAKGGKLGGSPKWKHETGVRFETSVGRDMYLWSSASARYTGRVRSDRADSVEDNAAVFVYPAHTTFNASIGLGRDAWEVQLWAKNLTDEKALTSNQSGGSVIGRRLIYTTPRTVGLNASRNF
jgi:iron complex outermembrane recepter protein